MYQVAEHTGDKSGSGSRLLCGSADEFVNGAGWDSMVGKTPFDEGQTDSNAVCYTVHLTLQGKNFLLQACYDIILSMRHTYYPLTKLG